MEILWNSFLGIKEDILSLFLLIDSKVYWFFSKAYSLYIDIARVRIFKTDAFQSTINNVYLIFGVLAIFIFTYVLLQDVVDPNKEKGGANVGKVVYRFILVSVILTFLPTVFNFLYDLQSSILSNGVISKILLSDNVNNNLSVYLQDSNGQYVFTDDCNASNYEQALAICEKVTISDANKNNYATITSAGYSIAYDVLNAFLSPADGRSDSDVVVDASDYMNLDKGLKISGILCAVGGGIATAVVVGLEIFTSPATGFATLAAVPSTIAAFGGTIALSCLGGAAIGAAASGITYAVTYEDYKWSDAKMEILADGDFNRITAFAEAITGGEMDYVPLISTAAGILLLYMIVSFCLDLGVRSAKLAFIEILAPISLLLSVIPSKKDLLNNWLKKLSATYFEVFIRITCVLGTALLVSRLDNTIIDSLGTVAKAIIVMGLVTFAKQLPKMAGDLTGIHADDIKLGIREKLAAGGAFAVGAVAMAGAKGFANNAVNAGRNFKNNFERGADGKIHKKAGINNRQIVRSVFGGFGSIAAGTVSSGFRSAIKGNVKNEKDMIQRANKSANDAIEARDKRATYRARHGNNTVGVLIGHIGDTAESIGKWAGIDSLNSLIEENKIIDGIQSLRKSIDKEATDLILGDLQKGKTAAAIHYNTALHNLDNLRQLQNDIKYQESHGTAADISLAQESYSKYLKDWMEEVANMSLLGKTSWEGLSRAQQADLSKIRMVTNEYREAVSRQINQPYVASLAGARDILDNDIDLTVNSPVLKDIKNEMKISQTEIQRKINRIQQKEQDKKGTK